MSGMVTYQHIALMVVLVMILASLVVVVNICLKNKHMLEKLYKYKGKYVTVREIKVSELEKDDIIMMVNDRYIIELKDFMGCKKNKYKWRTDDDTIIKLKGDDTVSLLFKYGATEKYIC